MSAHIIAALRAAGFLPAAEAAKACDIDQSTLHRWAATGTVEHRRVGRRLFVSAASLAAAVGPEVAAIAKLDILPAPRCARCGGLPGAECKAAPGLSCAAAAAAKVAP